MSGETTRRLHAYVSGRVQGVGFRFFVVDVAHRLGLTGWVRNLPDGRVEVVAEGKEERLWQCLELLRQGPRLAFVSEVHHRWEPATGEFVGFEIRY
jgi:acylphosphatase